MFLANLDPSAAKNKYRELLDYFNKKIAEALPR